MRFIQFLIFSLAYFASVTPLQAQYFGGRLCGPSELLVNIAVSRSEADQGSVCPHLDPRRRSFLFVNNKGTVFNPDQLINLYGPSTYDYCQTGDDGTRLQGLWRACLAKSVFKSQGQNSFVFGICSLEDDGSCSVTSYAERNYYFEIQKESGGFLELANFFIRGVGANVDFRCEQNGQSISGKQCAKSVGTETLLSETIAEIHRLLGQTNQLRQDAVTLTSTANVRIEEAEKILKSIKDKSFDQITEADLAAFSEALAILKTERAKAGELRAEVERQLETIRSSITEAQSKAKVELASLGIDVDNSETYQDLVDFEVTPAALPSLPDPNPIDPNDNVYKLLADKSLEAMQRSLDSNNRIEFLQINLSWSEKNKALLELYRPRLVASESERAEYEQQTRRVEDFLYGVEGKPGVLDRNGWFKDSLVPVDFQQLIDSMLARDANDPFATWLKQTMRPLPGKQATIDRETYDLILLSYSLVTYFNEFRKIYEEAVAQGYRPPPAAPPAVGQSNEFAGYSWQTLTKAHLETQKAIEEIKKAGVMGIDLYVSTSLASPLVSFCRILSGNSTCQFDGEKDLTGWDYVFSAADSLVFLGPLERVVAALKNLPSIGGKIFSASAKTLAVVDQIKTAAIDLGLKATQETIDFVFLLGKAGVKKTEDFVEYVKYLRLSKSAKAYVRIARKTDDIEKLLPKLKILHNEPVAPFYIDRVLSPQIGEVTDDIYLVRYYGEYGVGEVPKVGGKDVQGAFQKGAFWGNRLYISEAAFREGCVVFPEWNAAKRITQIKVKKGTRIVFGRGKEQTLGPGQTFDGIEKNIGNSPDWQFAFPPDPDWVAQGNQPGDWLKHLFDRGQLEIVEDAPSGWKL
jgi:hypothetical protein